MTGPLIRVVQCSIVSLFLACGGGSSGDDDTGDTGTWHKIDPAPPCIDIDLGVTVDPEGRPLVACTLDGPLATTRGGVATWTGAAWESEEIVTLDGWHADLCHIPLFDQSDRLRVVCKYWNDVALTERDAAPDRIAEVLWAPAEATATAATDLQLIGGTTLGFVVWVRDDSGVLWWESYGAADYGMVWRWNATGYQLASSQTMGAFQVIDDYPVSFVAYEDLDNGGRIRLANFDGQDLGFISAGPADQMHAALMPSLDRLWVAFRELDEAGVPHLVQVRDGNTIFFEQDLGIAYPVDEITVETFAQSVYVAYVDPTQGSSLQVKSCFSNPMCYDWDPPTQVSPGAAHLAAFDAQKHPSVIFVDETDPEKRPRVSKSGDDGWSDLGFPFATGGATVTATDIVWDDENQTLYVAAIVQDAGGTRQIVIARLNGTSWQQLAPVEGTPVNDALELRMTVEGIAAVGFVAEPQPGAAPRAALARVGTGRWIMKSELPDVAGVAVSAAGHTFWAGLVPADGGGFGVRAYRVEDDGARTDLGGPATGVPTDTIVRLAIGPGEVPFVLFEREDAEGGSDGRVTCVARWDEGTGETATWTELTHFEPGLPLGIVVTSDSVPLVALRVADSDTGLWVFKQGAEAWSDLGFAANDLMLPRRYADLALTADDHPIVAYYEDPDPYSRALYSTIWRSDTEWGTPALMYGSAAPVNGEFLDAIHPALALGADQTLYSAFMYRYYWEGNTSYQPHVMRWDPE